MFEERIIELSKMSSVLVDLKEIKKCCVCVIIHGIVEELFYIQQKNGFLTDTILSEYLKGGFCQNPQKPF